MWECSQSNNKYLDYKCYNKLHDYFNDSRIFKKTLEKLEIISKSVDINKYNSNEQKQIFNKLYEYLGGDGAFLYQDNNECCKYINYWLNNNVQKDLLSLYSETSFNILQNIVKLYNENNSSKQRCVSKIHYIDGRDLGKMVVLYNLYDKYNSLINYQRWFSDTKCEILSQASRFFYDTMDGYCDDDENLLIRLKEFKALIDKKVPNYNCSRDHSTYFRMPERFSKPKLKEHENQDKTLETSAHPSVPPTEQVKQQTLDSEGQSGNSEVKGLSESVTFERQAEETGDSRLVTETSSQQYLGDYSELSNSVDGRHAYDGWPSVARGSLEKIGSVKVGHLQEGEHNDILKNSMLLNFSGHSPATETLGLQNKVGQQLEDPSLLGKMKTAFFTMVESVEPAPILGVSGGMGALFLLFKYTPVGSFFGRRRGLNHRIPGGFPGAYPGFPEYYDSNFGNIPINISYQAE
ncbi:unnamed protein product [Plasmodium vivax]|uniref:(malaria parasite P. vivax) hypothetical protein n=1 Tax=Plasmodium vivax TaxID=5855 RepID=A0A8S4H7D0_PLAVI|nr:unnamed protein product [Plasmodium vivax]